MIHADMGDTVRSRWTIASHAVVAWRLVVPLRAAALYALLAQALRRAERRKIARVPEAV
jgi:hypothetical protein